MSPQVSHAGTHTADRQLSAKEVDHFDAIAALAHKRAGLVLPRDKAPMVLARISKRMRALGLESLAAYRALLESSEAEDERRELVFTLTTNVTAFMRESHHFDFLRARVLPPLIERARDGGRVRLWSAGCSTGQEPYSLAMVVLQSAPDAARLDMRILATDIDARVLAQARLGEYSEQECQSLPKPLLGTYFEPLGRKPGGAGAYRVSDAVRSIVSFRELNLLETWPMRGSFDVVFCRNVIIYFDRPTQNRLWARFDAILRNDAYLFVGHSERVDTAQFPQFKPCGTTTYQRGASDASSRKGS